MELLYTLLILLIAARLCSEVVERLQMPSLLGELIAGIVLGLIFHQFSDTFPLLASLNEKEFFKAITELGIFFLMLYAGIEMRPQDVGKSSFSAILVAIGGMVLPMGLGVGLGWLMLPESDYKIAQMLFLGVGLSITAVPVAIKVLTDLGRLKDRVGRIIVSAAVIDDVLSLLLLAVMTAFIQTGEMPGTKSLLILGGKIALFFVITTLLGMYVLPFIARFITRRISIDESEFSLLLIVALGFSVLAELLGMHFILGAFVAGLFFVKRDMKSSVYYDVRKKIKGITTGFLAPIFFVSIGLHLDLAAMVHIPVFVVVLTIIAVIGKVVGSGLPAKMLGLSTSESLAVGSGMNARGAVELIIADIALRAGLFEQPVGSELVSNLFSAMVIMAIVTTIITPITLKMIFKKT